MSSISSPLWFQHALAFERMLIHEYPGKDAHPLITAFFQYTQLAGQPASQSDETPWCSAFACACVELAGFESTRHALARSWDTWGVESPLRVGAIVTFKEPNHVAFCENPNFSATHILALGGNQNNKVCSRLYDRDRIAAVRWLK